MPNPEEDRHANRPKKSSFKPAESDQFQIGPRKTPLTTLSNSVTGPVAYSVSLIGIVGAGGILIFAGGQVNEFLRAVLFCVLVIAFIIAAKNTLTAFGFAAGAEITQSQSLTHGVVYGAPSGHVASSWD